jgi:hypothetical protein
MSLAGVGVYTPLPKSSYLSSAPFDTYFYSYDSVAGVLGPVPGASPTSCPANRVLRTTGRALYPDANPGVINFMVSVYDSETLLNGYIDPNAAVFAVYSTTTPYIAPRGVDPVTLVPNAGPPVYTQGRVNCGPVATTLIVPQLYNSGFAGISYTNTSPNADIFINPNLGNVFELMLGAAQSALTGRITCYLRDPSNPTQNVAPPAGQVLNLLIVNNNPNPITIIFSPGTTNSFISGGPSIIPASSYITFNFTLDGVNGYRTYIATGGNTGSGGATGPAGPDGATGPAGPGINYNAFSTIAIGFNAATIVQGNESVAIGFEAANSNQGLQAVAIGSGAALSSQQDYSVAIGVAAGAYNQGMDSVAVGDLAGNMSQSTFSVAVGTSAAQFNQADNAVAVGTSAGFEFQGSGAVALGMNAGTTSQGNYSVALGFQAGISDQSTQSIAIGLNAGSNMQQDGAIAIGANAGLSNQGTNAIAIGKSAGQTNQPKNSIVIGPSANATISDSIVIDSGNSYISITPSRVNISGCRFGRGPSPMWYNNATQEVSYGGTSDPLLDPSDIRLKTNIQDTSLGLEFIKQLRPIEYTWKDRESQHVIPDIYERLYDSETAKIMKPAPSPGVRVHQGFIAQDVSTLLSKLSTGKDYSMYSRELNPSTIFYDLNSLHKDEMIAPIVKAIQELTAQVECLQAQVNTLLALNNRS